MPFTEEDKAVFRHVKRYGTKRFLKEVLNSHVIFEQTADEDLSYAQTAENSEAA